MSARKILTPEQKVAILGEHLIEKVPVSQVCDKHGVIIVNFYNWQQKKEVIGELLQEHEQLKKEPMGHPEQKVAGLLRANRAMKYAIK